MTSSIEPKFNNKRNRCRDLDKLTRKRIKHSNLNNIQDDVSLLFTIDVKGPTTLIELSNRQLHRWKNNSIQLFGLQKSSSKPKKHHTITYTRAIYGDNLKPIKKKIQFGQHSEKTSYHSIDLSKVKHRYMMITCNKEELVSNGYNLKIQNSLLTDSHNPEKNSSGIVMLMMAALPNNDEKHSNIFKWDKKLFKVLSVCKNNVLQTYDHHGTSGKCFSFGNKPDYRNIDGVSVSTYSAKKCKDESKQSFIDCNIEFIENIFSDLVNERVEQLSRILPEIKLLLSPILNSAYEMQQTIDRTILTPLKVTKSGSWNSHIFVDSCTENFHVEKDCAYTCIHVPNQDFKKGTNICEQPGFVFQLNNNQRVLLPFNRTVSIVYNAQCLSHRQVYYPDNEKREYFFNVATYANEKLFNHLRKTFNRLS